VRASNLGAQALYAKLNFREVGRRKNYYSNPKEDALILRTDWGE
jgi:ribosomal protein S18 acetylase RimI-like enzyme